MHNGTAQQLQLLRMPCHWRAMLMILKEEENMMMEALMLSSMTLAFSWRPVSKQVGHDSLKIHYRGYRVLLICAD